MNRAPAAKRSPARKARGLAVLSDGDYPMLEMQRELEISRQHYADLFDLGIEALGLTRDPRREDVLGRAR